MPSSDAWRWRKHRGLAGAFAFVGGFADAVSMARWKSFPSLMTGNVLWLGRVIGDPEQNQMGLASVWYYFAIMLSFVGGAVAHGFAEARYPHRGASMVCIPFALLMVSFEVGTEYDLFNWKRSPYTAAGYAPMFGMVFAANSSGKLGAPTMTATGHFYKISNAFVKFCLGRLSFKDAGPVLVSCAVIIFTVLGAATGQAVLRHTRTNADLLLIPVGPVLAVLLWCHDHLAKPRSLVKRVQQEVRKRQQQRESCEGGECGNDQSEDEQATSDTSSAEDSNTESSAPDPHFVEDERVPAAARGPASNDPEAWARRVAPTGQGRGSV